LDAGEKMTGGQTREKNLWRRGRITLTDKPRGRGIAWDPKKEKKNHAFPFTKFTLD